MVGDSDSASFLLGPNTYSDTALEKGVAESSVNSASVKGIAWMVAVSKIIERPSGATPKLLGSMSDWLSTTSSFSSERGVRGNLHTLEAAAIACESKEVRYARIQCLNEKGRKMHHVQVFLGGKDGIIPPRGFTLLEDSVAGIGATYGAESCT